MADATKILVIRFSSIGDIVLTTPVIRQLKEQLDGPVELHYLTKKKFAGLLTGNPYIDEIHVIEKGTWEVADALKAINFDYIIDLHNNVRSNSIKRQLKSLAFTFKKHNLAKWLFVRFGWNRLPKKHIVERYLDTLSAFGVKDDGKGLDFYIPEEARQKVNEFLPENALKFVAISIGGAHIGKRMPAAKLAEIGQQIKSPIVLLGGKEDMDEAKEIERLCTFPVINLCGKLSIHESAAIIEKSEVVISGDTGLMHIAAALHKKIISLWGCTVPEFGMAPYRPHPDSVIIEPSQLKKRPCSKLGNRCKYGIEQRCITHIDASEVALTVQSLLNK